MNQPAPWMIGPPPARPIQPQQRATLHALHALASLFTFGFWLPVWLIVALVNNHHNEQVWAGYVHALARYDYDYWIWSQAMYAATNPRQLPQ